MSRETPAEFSNKFEERSSSLPTLKTKYYLGPTIKVRPKKIGPSKFAAEDVMKNYYDLKLSPEKKLDQYTKFGSQNAIDRFLNKSLLGKLTRSPLDDLNPLYQSFTERVREKDQEKPNSYQVTRGTIRTKEFLDPYSAEFFEELENLSEPVELEENLKPQDIIDFKYRQDKCYSILRRIFLENVIPKMLAKQESEEVGKMYFKILEHLVERYRKSMDSFDKLLAKHIKLIDSAKNDNFYIATKNERNLYNAVKYINNLYNPLIKMSAESREHYANALEEIRQTIREAERKDVIDQFQRDMETLNEHVRVITDRNIVLEQENLKLQRMNTEMNKRFEQEKNVISEHNNQIFQDMILKNFEEQNKRRLKELQREQNGGVDPDDSDISEELNEIEHQKHGINLERETLINEIHFFKSELQTMEAKLKKTSDDYEKLLNLKSKVEHERDNYKNQLLKTKVKTNDVGIQVKHSLAAPIKAKPDEIVEKDYASIQATSITALDQGVDWLFEVIDLICQDKVISDLRDDSDFRPRRNMLEYCKEWFLLKFGVQKVAGTMVRDFIHTIKKHYADNIRFRTFGMLLGINDIFEYHDDQKGYIFTPPIKSIRKAIISSSVGCSIYLKAVMSAKPVGKWCDSQTFHPDPNEKDSDNCEDKDLKKTMIKIIKEFNWSDTKVNTLVEQFQVFVEADIYDRLLGKNNLNGKDGRDYDDDDISYSVRLDCFSNFFLDKITNMLLTDIEEVYTFLSASSDNYSKAVFSIDNYKYAYYDNKIHRSSRYIEYSYFKLFEKEVSTSAMLIDIMIRMIPGFYESEAIYVGKKLPSDGYLMIPSYAEKMKLADLDAAATKYKNLKANHAFLKRNIDLIRNSSHKITKDHDNVEDLNMIDKDIEFMMTIVDKEIITPEEKTKTYQMISAGWSRLRMILRRNNTASNLHVVHQPNNEDK